jgi:hypothetical protein
LRDVLPRIVAINRAAIGGLACSRCRRRGDIDRGSDRGVPATANRRIPDAMIELTAHNKETEHATD